MTARSRSGWLVAETVVAAAIGTVVYYVLPVPKRMQTGSWVVVFCVGMAVLGCLIVLSIRRLLRERAEERARALVLLMCLAVLFFSYTDVILAREPGQFAGLHTRTDAIYFSISTLATVGFGDIHAAGQVARAAVTVQIVFNLLFIGAAASVLTGMMRTRAQRRQHPPGTSPAGGASAGEGTGPGSREGSGEGGAAPAG